MTERKPAEDLKEGFELLVRAAKNWGRGLTPEKVEASFEAGAREIVKAVSTVGKAVGTELEKMVEPSIPIPPGEPVPMPSSGAPPSKIRVDVSGNDAPAPSANANKEARPDGTKGDDRNEKSTLRSRPGAGSRA